MIAKKTIPFEQITPFVRHVHMSLIESALSPDSFKAYDSRLIYVYNGKGQIIIEETTHNVIKGCLLLWKPGIEYLIKSHKDFPLTIIGINYDYTREARNNSTPIAPDKTEHFDSRKITEYVQFNDMDCFNSPVVLENMQELESTLFEIKDEYITRKKYYINRINGLFLSLLGDVARYACSIKGRQGEFGVTIDRIIEWIHNNYSKPLSNKDIGRHFNFHPNYINRLMVMHTGTSLYKYVLNYRISQAINLMQSTSMNITEIANMVGFKDINHFSKYFKKTIGISPKHFRRGSH
jgi:AraC-like DNA-binding protein